MANAIERFFGKVYSNIITYTIGLVLPWWLVDFIADGFGAIESYESKSTKYRKIHRYTYGLILPWWTLYVFNPKKKEPYEEDVEDSRLRIKGSGVAASAMSESIDIKESEKSPKEKNYYCSQCGLHVVEEKTPIGKHGKCPEKPASNWAHKWTDMGYVGKFKSTCQLCGITINHDQQSIHSMKCVKGVQHKWKRA